MITKGTKRQGFHLHLLLIHTGSLLCITNKTSYGSLQLDIDYHNI